MEHDIPFGNSNRENGPTFLDFPLFLGIFQWDEPTKRVPFTAEPEIPEILTKWKAPSVLNFPLFFTGPTLTSQADSSDNFSDRSTKIRAKKQPFLIANISEILAAIELKLHSMFISFILNTFHEN